MATREEVQQIWPELEWIQNKELREQTLATWMLAFENSPLTPKDLEEIPFTLHVENLKVSFMDHKRLVVHICKTSAKSMAEFLGADLPVDEDTLLAGAILADVGKLLEYESVDGKTVQSARGKYLRHPFTGVGLAMECGVPDAVCHIIATHAGEGNLVKRTTEAFIVHHIDFMTYEPCVKGLKV